jgi:hypothetical protein
MRQFIASLTLTAALASTTVTQAGALPAWDKKITGPGRFKVLKSFNDGAVLDKETGLVWEKTASLAGNWRNTLRFCALRNTGGRMGWRVPALEELLTLFWTANEEEGDPTLVVTVSLDVFTLSGAAKTASRKVLCVRGGRGSTAPVRGGL